MVSMNPNSPEGFYLEPNGTGNGNGNGLALPGLTPFSNHNYSAENSNSSSAAEDSKKVRKPYTITKSRESWTDPEHDKFLEALHLFDRDWKKIEAFVGSKTVIQIRSHAQKYFLKVQKSGSNEHLPPPRPKRKAAHPYPQKAPKNAASLPQPTGSFQSSLEPKVQRPDSAPMPMCPNNSTVPSSWDVNPQTVGVPKKIRGDIRKMGTPITNNYSSSTESTLMLRAPGKVNEPLNYGPPLRVLPDFAQVYNFIGSVFDPGSSRDHLRRLKRMDPIDVETALLLMRNLSINLTSPDFEDHRRLLASYDTDTGRISSSFYGG